ncbi:MAG: YkgJ family cysteine cluster protein [Proteobacteria bacterium]|nr:YkgJ family cysteine cluster protein [Pseudomonadota bacterium]
MIPDFSETFAKYDSLAAFAEATFDKVAATYPDLTACHAGCADCCHALFDLSLVEALYLNRKFNEKFSGAQRDRIIERANAADRKAHVVKRDAANAVARGKDMEEVFAKVSWERVRCPLLSDDDRCEMYESRPITCRIYGIPTSTEGKSHICGKTRFSEGRAYPTANMDALHRQLYILSQELVDAMPTRHVKMADMLVPLSMALLTDYNEEYLGIARPEPEPGSCEKPRHGKKGVL